MMINLSLWYGGLVDQVGPYVAFEANETNTSVQFC